MVTTYGTYSDGTGAIGTTSSRVWRLHQIGRFLAPQWDAETEVTFESPVLNVPVYRGITLDPFRCERMPLGSGTLVHAGKYKPCAGEPARAIMKAMCRPFVDVKDGIASLVGTYAPAVFVSDPVPCETSDNGACCNFAVPCVTWAWAYVRLESVRSVSNPEVYTTSGQVAVEIRGRIESPLRGIANANPVGWSSTIWRYGPAYNVAPKHGHLIGADRERTVGDQYLDGHWRIPCAPSGCCSPDRWWFMGEPEHLPAKKFTASLWDADGVTTVISDARGAATNITVEGAHAPITYVRMGADVTLTLSNDAGEFTYFYPGADFGQIYTNSLTGEALLWQDNRYRQAPGIFTLPRLEPGVNRIHIDRSFAEVGWKCMWI